MWTSMEWSQDTVWLHGATIDFLPREGHTSTVDRLPLRNQLPLLYQLTPNCCDPIAELWCHIQDKRDYFHVSIPRDCNV